MRIISFEGTHTESRRMVQADGVIKINSPSESYEEAWHDAQEEIVTFYPR